MFRRYFMFSRACSFEVGATCLVLKKKFAFRSFYKEVLLHKIVVSSNFFKLLFSRIKVGCYMVSKEPKIL